MTAGPGQLSYLLYTTGDIDGRYLCHRLKDNRGGRAKGTWVAQDDKLISKSERIDAEGNAQKSGAVYTKVNNKTIKIALYGLNDYDELSDEPWFSMDFKRQARKPKKPAAK